MASQFTKTPVAKDGQVAGTQTIRRAFLVLNLLRDEGKDMGVVQISQRLGLNLSTAHRIARGLVAEGYLSQDEGRERYRLGPQALLLGQAAQRALGMDVARPVLERLASVTDESVNLGLLDGHQVVVIQRIESSQPLRFSMEAGTRIELHATSMGKAVLAFNDDLGTYLDQQDEPLKQATEKTHSTLAGVRSDLEMIRERGWSTDDEESVLGVRCVGAPIFDSTGQARAAVAIQAPAVRMPYARFEELGAVVMEAASELGRVVPL
ncbi:MAG: helix-turn-helix domain-containing protein [Actinophytocola sp.]|nr:helix-turn-helix domain-containing protein [Actinophytocola sp.]